MKKLTFALSFFLILLFSFKNENKKFPEMIGEKLDGTQLVLPIDLKGKFSLLVLAYSQKAEADLKTWQLPLYSKFIAKPKAGSTFAFSTYDINLLFVPMFSGVNQTAEGQAKKKMKAELDLEMQKHFMIFKGNSKLIKEQLSMSEKDLPYLLLLNKEGDIVYKTSGSFSQTKMGGIEDNIED